MARPHDNAARRRPRSLRRLWHDGPRRTLEGPAILIEREAEYCADIARRMEHALSSIRERKRTHLKRRGKVEAPGPLFEVAP